MATYQWITASKQSNTRKSITLLISFPIFLFILITVVFLFADTNSLYSRGERFDVALQSSSAFLMILVPIIVIRGLIVFYFQKQIIFRFAGARELTRKENPEIYNIVENLCISKGLPTPKIWTIDTPGLNAFATGWKASDSRVVFTSGLLKTLDKSEIEAVAAHELSHIINKDSLLMLISVVYIGIISTLGSILIRVRGNSNSKGGNVLPLIGIALIILGYLVYPLLRLAISRKREFLADLGAVELTKDSQAMMSALQKISGRSRVPSANENMAMFFISSPASELGADQKPQKSSIRDTHPSIDERVSALKNY